MHDTIRQMYCEEQLSTYEIAKALSIKRDLVCRELKVAGVQLRNRIEASRMGTKKRVWTPEILAKISASKRGKIPSREIVERRAKAQRGTWRVTLPISDEEIRSLYSEGHGLRWFSRTYGFDASTWGNRLREMGVVLRAPKAASVAYKGDKHPRWNGGARTNTEQRQTAEVRAWRKKVFARDGYTCQECGQKGGRLNADHILPFALFPELRTEVRNGRTLCEKCHKETDTYTNTRMTRDDFRTLGECSVSVSY